MTDALTALELSELAQCEAVIAHGLRTFVDIGSGAAEDSRRRTLQKGVDDV